MKNASQFNIYSVSAFPLVVHTYVRYIHMYTCKELHVYAKVLTIFMLQYNNIIPGVNWNYLVTLSANNFPTILLCFWNSKLFDVSWNMKVFSSIWWYIQVDRCSMHHQTLSTQLSGGCIFMYPPPQPCLLQNIKYKLYLTCYPNYKSHILKYGNGGFLFL